MIGNDTEEAARFVDGFKGLIGYETLARHHAAEFDELAASAMDARFPGALLVWPREGKPCVYYAIARNGAEWRRLRPLLIAYVGPTLTSFKGWPEPLLADKVPVEAYLAGGNWHTVVRLVPGVEPKTQEMTRRSMARMLAMLSRAPSTSHAAPRSTSSLLSLFADRLNGNDYAGATQILETCRSELRLDALNLLFLRVRMFAHFRDWASIMQMPQFLSLCHTRKPPLITATLLEAIYHVRVAKGMTELDVPALLNEWDDDKRALARPLLKWPIPAVCGVGALRLYALEALSLQNRDLDLEQAILEYRDALGPLAEALVASGRTGRPAPPSKMEHDADPVATTQLALASAENDNTLATIAAALDKLKDLDETARSQLLASCTFKLIVEELVSESGGSAPPTDWHQWLARLSDPEFTSAQALLQRAVVEWPATGLVDPTEISRFAVSLSEVPDTPPAAERMADAIPWLVNWVASDPQFPRAGMRAVYETLLFHLMIGMRRGTAVFDSAAVLIRALLQVGLSAKEYERLLDDCLVLLGEGMGQRAVYWLFDILEETVQNPCPSPASRQAFWYSCHERLKDLETYFTPGQRIAFDKLSVNLGWPVMQPDAPSAAPGDDRAAIVRDALKSKCIGIYTLTESAARQAEAAFKLMSSDVSISISSDTVGTTMLKSLSQTADILVVVTASAKHAATNFIQQMRPKDKPLLFANGRGFSSIVRVVEEHLLGGSL